MTIKKLFCIIVVLSVISTGVKAAPTPLFEQISPDPTIYVENEDWALFTAFSLSGETMGVLESPLSFGCFSNDFNGFTAGSVALIARGNCSFSRKVQNASDAGAVGAIIFNNTAGVFGGTLGSLKDIIAISISQELGFRLLTQMDQAPVTVRFRVVDPAEVPLPGAAWLFAAGVFALNRGTQKLL